MILYYWSFAIFRDIQRYRARSHWTGRAIFFFLFHVIFFFHLRQERQPAAVPTRTYPLHSWPDCPTLLLRPSESKHVVTCPSVVQLQRPHLHVHILRPSSKIFTKQVNAINVVILLFLLIIMVKRRSTKTNIYVCDAQPRFRPKIALLGFIVVVCQIFFFFFTVIYIWGDPIFNGSVDEKCKVIIRFVRSWPVLCCYIFKFVKPTGPAFACYAYNNYRGILFSPVVRKLFLYTIFPGVCFFFFF